MAASSAESVKITDHDKQILKQIFNPGLPYGDDIEEDELKEESCDDSEEVKKAKALEIQGVKAAEAGDVDAALAIFTEAVNVAPNWPSAYNNRAQALRLKGDIEGAKADLEKALELSSEKGTPACQAFTQRGLIRKKEGDDEGARHDFKRAADLGSGFAKQLLASMNPYAALCNQMLGEVMQKLRSGACEEQ
ncbi:tetratricopeptide repeat protein 36-like [Physella acuta]|uniref:tetratricopeptide repeat protein 36-like n=1 Tax=Physella acuta TaxID=109671 RepID=UPI0027DC53F5|nr:tetratricopeptide repeat protein 36-like [Physella acuta]